MAGLFDREIVDYALVTGEHEFVSKTVPKFIQKGWQPFGVTTHVISHYGSQYFAQAMVKYAADDEAATNEQDQG